MTIISIRTFVATELQRLKEWFGEAADSLDSVETVRTIGDCIESGDIESRLPAGWRVDREIVQFPGESLAEVVRLTGRDGSRISLKPIDMYAPTDRIELYTRASPGRSRQQRRRVDSLSEAVTVATEIAATQHTRSNESTSPTADSTSQSTEESSTDSSRWL